MIRATIGHSALASKEYAKPKTLCKIKENYVSKEQEIVEVLCAGTQKEKCTTL